MKVPSIWTTENKRWSEALALSFEELTKSETLNKALKDEEYHHIVTSLNSSYGISKSTFELLFREGPSLFESINGIQRWERYITVFRSLLIKSNESLLTKLIISALGFNEINNTIKLWKNEILKSIPDLRTTLKEINNYIIYYKKGSDIVANTKKTDPQHVRLYASLKTWDTDNRFEHFSTNLSSILNSSIKIYIEGPIQLYLIIMDKHFLIFIRPFILNSLSDQLNKTELADIQLLSDHLKKIIHDSKTINYIKTLMYKTIERSMRDWTEEHEKLRISQPTQELRKRFIKNFEDGVYNL